jgi:hypothetical protein
MEQILQKRLQEFEEERLALQDRIASMSEDLRGQEDTSSRVADLQVTHYYSAAALGFFLMLVFVLGPEDFRLKAAALSTALNFLYGNSMVEQQSTH